MEAFNEGLAHLVGAVNVLACADASVELRLIEDRLSTCVEGAEGVGKRKGERKGCRSEEGRKRVDFKRNGGRVGIIFGRGCVHACIDRRPVRGWAAIEERETYDRGIPSECSWRVDSWSWLGIRRT